WNKNVATIYIRPQRYTYSFIEDSDTFTISFLKDGYKKALEFCGKNSGRNCDKVKESGLSPFSTDSGIAFEEAKLILVCKKLYFDERVPFCTAFSNQ
ncbi:MAG: flavin reductase family protein, partial [Oscillospiraceae bacterium]